MTQRVQRLRHTAAEAALFVGLEGEITVDKESGSIHLHDGSTPGGKIFLSVSDLAALFPGASAIISAIAALDGSGILVKGDSTAVVREIIGGTAVTVTNGNGVGGNPTIAVNGLGTNAGTSGTAGAYDVGTAAGNLVTKANIDSAIATAVGDGVAGLASQAYVTAAISDAAVPDAATDTKGKVQLATDAITQALANALLAVTPANLASLTPSTDRLGLVQKALQADTNAGTADKFPDALQLKAQLVESAEITITDGTSGTWAHGLGVAAKFVQAFARCKNAAAGYAVGDEIPLYFGISGGPAGIGLQAAISGATTIKYAIGFGGVYIGNGTNGNLVKINSDFKLFLRAKPY